jgi:hypothetical protein
LSDQFNKDATGIQKFVKGLSNAKDEGQNLSLVLEDLELQRKSIHRGRFFVQV